MSPTHRTSLVAPLLAAAVMLACAEGSPLPANKASTEPGGAGASAAGAPGAGGGAPQAGTSGWVPAGGMPGAGGAGSSGGQPAVNEEAGVGQAGTPGGSGGEASAGAAGAGAGAGEAGMAGSGGAAGAPACVPQACADLAPACGTLDDGCGASLSCECAPLGSIVAGASHSCALRASGQVACWGFNVFGQLGIGNTQSPKTSAVNVSGLADASMLAAGDGFSCALRSTGAVSCWGQNGFGQLGDGSTSQRTAPVAVSGLLGAVGIAAGREHACAIMAGGAVSCWGRNDFGQLGQGSTSSPKKTPAAVSGIADAVEVAAAGWFSCARRASGAVSCWGWNSFGQLASGSSGAHAAPADVPGVSDAVQLALGNEHACALRASGAAVCWGRNDQGQLGIGTTSSKESTPKAVSGLSSAVALSAGSAHSCALLADSSIACWGENLWGQLGDGTKTRRLVPTPVASVSGALALAAGSGEGHSCARLDADLVRCWGYNALGQLGSGKVSTSEATSVAVVGLGP